MIAGAAKVNRMTAFQMVALDKHIAHITTA